MSPANTPPVPATISPGELSGKSWMIPPGKSVACRAATVGVIASLIYSGCGTGRRLHTTRVAVSDMGKSLSDKATLFVEGTFGTEHIQMIFHKPVAEVEKEIQEIFSAKRYTMTRANGGFMVREAGMGTRYCFIQVMEWDGSKELKKYPINTLVDVVYISARSEKQMEEKRLPIPFHIQSRLKKLAKS